ncbi:methyltransferase domain-containing protein [Streptomyces sp. NPDC050738]|uniref:methyltransferase domain-containing protein n=1 Tax=Streptomyces sp. NPDC050738 TaxID=3154744 RepID=UPI0034224986
MNENRAYAFEDRAAEHERLLAQARVFEPFTRRLLLDAGLAPGMRVLDLGSGAGSVSLLAAEIVGPKGSVVGIERDPGGVALAQRYAEDAGFGQVEFRQGDVQTLEGVEPGFDAVVGRLVLMYLPDPAAALREAAARTSTGAPVCMQEADLSYVWSTVSSPLWEQCRGWFHTALEKAGAAPRMGLALHDVYRDAGLPAPQLRLEATVESGPDASVFGWANVVIGILPLLERLGIATREEVGPATLTDRLRAELLDQDGLLISPLMIGAWSETSA